METLLAVLDVIRARLPRRALACSLMLGAIPLRAATVNLAWDPVTVRADGTQPVNLAGYRLFYSLTSFNRGGTWLSPEQAAVDSSVQTINLPATASTYSLNINPDTRYYIRLTASDTDGGQSAFNLSATGADAELSAFVAGALGSTPTNVRFTAVSNVAVSLAWTLDTPSSEAPLVVFSTMSDFSVVLASATGSIGLQTTSYAVIDNTTYYFKVKISTESDAYYSAPIFALTAAATPTNIVFEVFPTKIIASAYAPTPAFSNLDQGMSGVNVTMIGRDYAGYRTGNIWRTKAPIPTARHNIAGASVGDKIYAIGGYNGTAFLATNDEYDPASDTWSAKTSMPTARTGSAAAAAGGKVYVIGGVNWPTRPSMAPSNLSANEEYDPATDTWSTKAGMPTPRNSMGAAATGGKVYIFGGVNFSRPPMTFATTEEYDLASDSWATKTSMPTVRHSLAAAAAGGKVYAVGGHDGGSFATNEEFDPAGNTWTTKAGMPRIRYAHATASVGGKVYFIGGWDRGTLSDNAEYDPAANTWATRAPMPAPRYAMVAAAAGGKIYAIGGTNNTVDILATNAEYDPGVAAQFTGLVPNTLYSFKAKARNAVGSETGESPVVDTYTLAVRPGPAAGPSAFTSVSANGMIVNWSAGTPATGYNPLNSTVYLAQISTMASFTPLAASARTTNLNAAFSSLNPATIYYARVQAINGNGIPTAFANLGFTTTAANPPPAGASTVLGLALEPAETGTPATLAASKWMGNLPRARNVILVVKTVDPSFPNDAALSAELGMPSGLKTVTLTKMSSEPLRYVARVDRNLFSRQDFYSLENTTVTLVVGGQTFVARGREGLIEPELGGVIEEAVGAAQVVIRSGQISQEAKVTIQQEPFDTVGRRQEMLSRQNLQSMGPGREIVMASSGTLRSALLVLPFDPGLIPQGLDASQLAISYFNPASGMWETENRIAVVGNTLRSEVTHLSLYKPTLLLPSSIPGLRNSLVYPNPAVSQDPVIRALIGSVDRMEVTIFDISGQQVHSGSRSGAPTGISGGEYYYDYVWSGPKSSGVYVAIIHGKKGDGTTVHARARFAVVN